MSFEQKAAVSKAFGALVWVSAFAAASTTAAIRVGGWRESVVNARQVTAWADVASQWVEAVLAVVEVVTEWLTLPGVSLCVGRRDSGGGGG